MGGLEEYGAQCTRVSMVDRAAVLRRWELAILKNTHHYSTAAVGAGVLREIVAAREFLAAFVTLKRFVVGVKRTVVTL